MFKLLDFLNRNLAKITQAHGALTVIHDTLIVLVRTLNDVLGSRNNGPNLPPPASPPAAL